MSDIWKRCFIVFALFGATATGALAQLAPSEEVLYRTDSRLIADANPGAAPGMQAQLVWFEEISIPDSAWMRIHFTTDTLLAGSDRHQGGSYLVITSMHDGAQQFLDATSLDQWDNISAFLNGDTVMVELYATPGMGNNRVQIDKITAGIAAGLGESICGTTDDRVPYNDPRVGRLSTACTAFLINRNGAANEFLTAGHCINNNQAGVVVMFNLPAANANGGLVAPPPEFQYAVQRLSIQSLNNAAVGDEYARFNTSENSNTGMSARVGQGRGAYGLAASAPSGGTAATTVQGNGITNTGQAGVAIVPNQYNRINKVHTGPYGGRVGTRINYTMDTEGGNSGSPVTQVPILPPPTPRVIGIHTDGFCTSTGGTNSGTAIQHPGLQNALANPQGDPEPFQSHVSKGITTTRFANNAGGDGGSIYFDVAVGSKAIEITSFLLNINRNGVTSNGSPSEGDDFFNFEVYIAPETAMGKFVNPNLHWTKVADGAGMPKFEDEYSLGALKSTIFLGANKSFGVAIIFDTAAGHRYTNANGSNEVYSNPDLTITGVAASNSKFGSTIYDRIFNGGINYDLNQAPGQCVETIYASDNNGVNGGMAYFDAFIKPQSIAVSAVSVNTAAAPGSKVDIKLYRTATTYVGKTGSSAGWTLIGQGSGTSAGKDAPSHIALNDFARLAGGVSHGLAIQLTHDDANVSTGHQYTNGNGWNQEYSDKYIDLTLGAATSTPFGSPTPFTPRVFNGSLCYGLDLAMCRSPLFDHSPPDGTLAAYKSVATSQEEADNFKVTNNWSITSATFWAVYTATPTPPTSMDMVIRIFEDDNGLPGGLVEIRGAPDVQAIDTGLVLSLSPTDPSIYQYDAIFPQIDLPEGSYWISVLDADPNSQWSWTRTDTRLNEHAFRSGPSGNWALSGGNFAFTLCGTESLSCYADCDKSTGIGKLDIFDFLCFQNSFVAGETYACDCDTSTGKGVCDIFDFLCFQDAFVGGCN